MSSGSQEDLLTIGELGKKTKLRVSALRFYERKGLISPTSRSASNYRLYGKEALSQVLFLRRAQSLGFSLEEIRELLMWRQREEGCCSQVQAQAQKTAQKLEEKMSFLAEMLRALHVLIEQCPGEDGPQPCPILHALEAEGAF